MGLFTKSKYDAGRKLAYSDPKAGIEMMLSDPKLTARQAYTISCVAWENNLPDYEKKALAKKAEIETKED